MQANVWKEFIFFLEIILKNEAFHVASDAQIQMILQNFSV